MAYLLRFSSAREQEMVGQVLARALHSRTQQNSEYEGNEKDPATFEQLKKMFSYFKNAAEKIYIL